MASFRKPLAARHRLSLKTRVWSGMQGKIALLFCGVMSAFCVEGQAVIGFGSVTGTVRDYTHTGIPDTSVVLSNEKLGINWTLTSTDDGVFYAPTVVPATGYRLKVSHKGFLDEEYK